MYKLNKQASTILHEKKMFGGSNMKNMGVSGPPKHKNCIVNLNSKSGLGSNSTQGSTEFFLGNWINFTNPKAKHFP